MIIEANVLKLTTLRDDILEIVLGIRSLYNAMIDLDPSLKDDDLYDQFRQPINEAEKIVSSLESIDSDVYWNIMCRLEAALSVVTVNRYATLVNDLFNVTIEGKPKVSAMIVNTAMYFSHRMKALYILVHACVESFVINDMELTVHLRSIPQDNATITVSTNIDSK